MKNESVVYITPVVVPSSCAASKRILANVKLLQLLNFDVTIYSGEETKEPYNMDGINIIPSGKGIESLNGIRKFISYIKSIKGICAKLNEKDILNIKAIILYSGYSFFLFHLIRWAKVKKIALVFDATEWYSPSKKFHWFYKPYFWNTEFAMRFLIPKTKNVIAISSYLENYYKNKGCNTVIIPPLYYETQEINKRIKDNNVKISYTGSPGKKDMLNQILEAIIQINEQKLEKQCFFDVAGINEQQLLTYQAFTKRDLKVLPQYIKGYGYVSMKKAQEITSQSDFSVLFREKNVQNTAGFPTKVVESLSLGVPVLLNYTSDLRKYLFNAENAIVIDTPNVSSIKLSLLKIMSLPVDELNIMKLNAKDTAVSNFFINSKITPLKSFIQNLKV